MESPIIYACKHCGQRLLEGTETQIFANAGWRLSKDGVWQPTPQAQTRFDWARRTVMNSATDASTRDKLRVKLAHGVGAFARFSYQKHTHVQTVTIDLTMLPVRIACPQCHGITPFD